MNIADERKSNSFSSVLHHFNFYFHWENKYGPLLVHLACFCLSEPDEGYKQKSDLLGYAIKFNILVFVNLSEYLFFIVLFACR